MSDTKKMPRGFCPGGMYTVAIESITQEPSKKGAPMDKLTVHIIAPDKAFVRNGNVIEEYDVAGLKTYIYLCYIDNSFFAGTCDALTKLGINVPAEGTFEQKVAAIQAQTKALSRPYVKGLPGQSLYVFEAVVSSAIRYATLPLSLADITAGRDQGQLAKDAAGQPIPIGANIEIQTSGIVGGLRESQMPF